MPKFIDIKGKRFTKLLVIERSSNKKLDIHWDCVCDCGGATCVSGKNLRSGSTKSCGCIKSKLVSDKNRTHDMSGTDEYKIWCGIIKRCTKGRIYDQKGISVSRRWEKFINFYNDMGIRKSNLHSIDRINNEKGYSKSNCRWATRFEQNENRSNTIWVEIEGQKMSLKRACRESGLNYSTVHSSIRRNNICPQKVIENHVIKRPM